MDPSYDAAGNLTIAPRSLFPTDWELYKYDAWNRLISTDNSSYTAATYEYDGLHQRIVRDPVASPVTGPPVHYYYNDQWQLLTETVEVSGVENVYAIYHWHPHYVDALALRMRASDTHAFLHDANFNVTAAVDDSTNAVVERYQYTPYGTPTVLDANFAADSDGYSDILNTHLYTGRERDPETGLQLNRHRYYASHLGRWLTRDPIGYAGGDLNLYCYTYSSPIKNTDPSGWSPGGAYGCKCANRAGDCRACCESEFPSRPAPGKGEMNGNLRDCIRKCREKRGDDGPQPIIQPPCLGELCHYYSEDDSNDDGCEKDADDAYQRCKDKIEDDFDCDSKPGALRPLCDALADALQGLECGAGYGIFRAGCELADF